MVNALLCSTAMAIARADDSISMLQVSAVERSTGQRILDAVAEDGQDTICVDVTAGDVAPVHGSFSARKSEQAVEVPAGSIAGEGGSFCVPKRNVLLLQRTHGLATARDLDAVLGQKGKKPVNAKETVNADNYDTWDFVGDYTNKLTVTATAKQCPAPVPELGLLQTMDATVTKKKNNKDEERVCVCRRHLEEAGYWTSVKETYVDFCAMTWKKTDDKQQPQDRWAAFAKSLNYPSRSSYSDTHGPAHQRKPGSEHCDKSWVLRAACDPPNVR